MGAKGLGLPHFHKPTPLLFLLFGKVDTHLPEISRKTPSRIFSSYKKENTVKLPIFDWIVQISFNVQNTLSFQSSASQSHSLDNCHLCIYQLTHPPPCPSVSLSFSIPTCTYTYTSTYLSLSPNLFLPLSIGD